jgi:hypothetical protein
MAAAIPGLVTLLVTGNFREIGNKGPDRIAGKAGSDTVLKTNDP